MTDDTTATDAQTTESDDADATASEDGHRPPTAFDGLVFVRETERARPIDRS